MNLLDVRPELVAEIAAGVENPELVAARYGFEGNAWEQLRAWKPFTDAVEAQRADFEKSGYTFRLKSAMKADALADRLFVQALTNEATFLQKMEALKFFTKVGELEPSPKNVMPTGPAFSITIDLSNQGVSMQKNVTTLEIKSDTDSQVDDEPDVNKVSNTLTLPDEAVSDAVEVPLTVTGFKLPDIDLTPGPAATATKTARE